MSRPLFVGSYLQVTVVTANGREEKTASNDDRGYLLRTEIAKAT